ncbi:hypothetical protein ABZ408_40925, partial [Streptomyces tibetensis]|uniref:hypothetical protein n=1 Tax=Streptomyces tibetensis TaxID=2382123 RepID=UPI0033C33349
RLVRHLSNPRQQHHSSIPAQLDPRTAKRNDVILDALPDRQAALAAVRLSRAKRAVVASGRRGGAAVLLATVAK